MTALDPRSFLYRDSLDPEAALSLTAGALSRADDGELFLQYRKSEAFGFDDGRLKTASYDTHSGFGLRAVSGEMTAFAHASELSEAAIKRAAFHAILDEEEPRLGTAGGLIATIRAEIG